MNNILTVEDIKQILENRTKHYEYKTLNTLPNPLLFKDMEKAVKRVAQAIKENETVNIVGDYDVDGVVSTAIMVNFFNNLGIKVNYIIPNRFEHGYGLSPLIVEKIKEGLIITVDNGISAFEAAKICKDRNLDLIITDHHTVSDKLPHAYAVINPKQSDCRFPFKEICGAQVAWYFCAALKNELNVKYDLIKLFDILCLAIVADIMPMVSLNQTMVKYGLKALETSIKPAVLALKEKFFLSNITEDDIGFKFAPLINCAGRIADPIIALEFLLCDNIHEANETLDYLISLNEERKRQQLKIFNEAKAQVKEEDEVIVVSCSSWNEGIIGIVASKLCEKYKKPSFVFSLNETIAKASSRSIPEVHLFNLIQSCSEHLEAYGGHKQAAGLTCKVENLDIFRQKLNQNVSFFKEQNDQNNTVLGEFCINHINPYTHKLIESFRPFGLENPYPVFEFKNMNVVNISKMGKNKEFTKIIVSNGKNQIEVVCFVDFDYPVKIDDKISFLATVSKNEFRGEITYNLMFKELTEL